jgi:stage II sporulation SpoE-like protein
VSRRRAGGSPQRPVEPDLDLPARALEADLLADAPIGVLACDPGGVVRAANREAVRLLPGLVVGEPADGPAAPLSTADGAGDLELVVGDRAVQAQRRARPDGWTGWYLRDVTESRARLDALLVERARARFLADAGQQLGRSLHPGRTARTVARLAAELADDAVVVLPVVLGAAEWFRSGRRTGDGLLPVAELPEPVAAALRGLAVAPAPLLAAELDGEPWTADGTPAAADVRALPGDGRPAGALVLMRYADGPFRPELDAELVEAFTERAGAALTAAALHAQRARTAEVHERTVHEPRPPRPPGLEIAAVHRPAPEGFLVGADFSDVHTDPDGTTALLIGDVRGRDVDAAVTAGQVRHAVRVLRRLHPDPVRVLELLNTLLLETVPADGDPRFATLVLGAARALPDGGLRLHLGGGGHPPPLLVRHGGVEPVDIGGIPVGALLPPPGFHARTVHLGPGEACVLYTEGVVAARGGADGAEFGEERLAALLRGCHILPAAGIVERVLDHTTRWTGAHQPGWDGAGRGVSVLVVQAAAPAPRRHLSLVRAGPDESARPAPGRHRLR